MKQLALFGLIAIALTSCINEDPGSIQEQKKEYSITNFDRLEMSDALRVTVVQGNTFAVVVEGDRRNIDDLDVRTVGSTLRMGFITNHSTNRQYKTYITIVMPTLEGISFSGAVNSSITGFSTTGEFDIKLSGASTLMVNGSSKIYRAELSGASELYAFQLEAEAANIQVSGASKAEVMATQTLNANASGASKIRYRGNPTVTANTSGASAISPD